MHTKRTHNSHNKSQRRLKKDGGKSMFDNKCVNDVIVEMEKSFGLFASEAQLQLSFALAAYKLYGNRFSYIPEYPDSLSGFKRDEVDLLIIDNLTKEKTMIEFKFKTTNYSNHSLEIDLLGGVKIKPTIMNSGNLGRYDCWSDIERLENYKSCGKAKACFFVFVTNDDNFLNKPKSECDFSVENSVSNGKKKMMWDDSKQTNGVLPTGHPKIKSIGTTRNRPLVIKGEYTFIYEPYCKSYGKRRADQYYIATVEIK